MQEGFDALDAEERPWPLNTARKFCRGLPNAEDLAQDPVQTTLVQYLQGYAQELGSGAILDLARYSLGDVEQMEIVQGPASVLYGSDAIGGVINLITSRLTAPLAGRRAPPTVPPAAGPARRRQLGTRLAHRAPPQLSNQQEY